MQILTLIFTQTCPARHKNQGLKTLLGYLLLINCLNIQQAFALETSILGLDTSLSGFGSANFAISDQAYRYTRYVDNDGTFNRGSLFALQADIKFNEQFSTTIQGKLAPAQYNDYQWEPSLTWALLTWRPTNDLLFRFGKQRGQFYLFSETLDLAQSYDFMQLPTELYRTIVAPDFWGGSIAKTWESAYGELTLDAYLGYKEAKWRTHFRNDLTTLPYPTGVQYADTGVLNSGMVLTLLANHNKFRIGIHPQALSALNGKAFPGSVELYSAAQLSPEDLSPWLSGSAYSVKPNQSVTEFNALIIALGAEFELPHNFRVITEFIHRDIYGRKVGTALNSGYIALFKDINHFSPYVSFSIASSQDSIAKLFKNINHAQGLSVAPNTPNNLLSTANNFVTVANAGQLFAADTLAFVDQYTFALGTAYQLSPKQKIKLEWARTTIGLGSFYVDSPSRTNINNQAIDVFSVSYNFAF
jgi:hypothetical protein